MCCGGFLEPKNPELEVFRCMLVIQRGQLISKRIKTISRCMLGIERGQLITRKNEN